MSNNKLYLESPIFSLLSLKESIIVSMGGGGKRFGLKNKIVIFKKPRLGFVLKDIVQTLELGDEEIVENLKINMKTNLIVANSESTCLIYYVCENGLEMKEVSRFQTDFAQKEPNQNDAIINPNGNVLATGGEDGVLRLWTISKKDLDYSFQKNYEFESDSGKVKSLDFHVSQPLLLAAYEKQECKLINYEKKTVLKKLSISNSGQLNLHFFSAIFSLDEKNIITIKNPFKGASYLTVWSMQKDVIELIKTKKINDYPISAVCQSREGLYLGVGGSDGSKKIINMRYYDYEAEDKSAHDMVVKGLSFTPDSRFLLSGGTDFTYHFLPNIRPEGLFSKITKLWVLAMVLIYLFQLMLKIFE